MAECFPPAHIFVAMKKKKMEMHNFALILFYLNINLRLKLNKFLESSKFVYFFSITM